MPERMPSGANRSRALRLLAGGTVGGLACWIACLIVFGLSGGTDALVWATIGGGGTLAFFVLGGLVQVGFAEAGAAVAAGASLLSYLVRAGGLLVLLVSFGGDTPEVSRPAALVVSVVAVAVVAGWLAVEIWTFTRLRIPAFDPLDRA